jgi:hypothetical protein
MQLLQKPALTKQVLPRSNKLTTFNNTEMLAAHSQDQMAQIFHYTLEFSLLFLTWNICECKQGYSKWLVVMQKHVDNIKMVIHLGQ